MTVKELIAILQSKPQDLQVAYAKYSEFCLLKATDIVIDSLCEPRPDGWVHDRRPDKPQQEYLFFPGN
jgi:hypothetical protein